MSLDDSRPYLAEIQGEHPYAQLAQKHWLKPTKKTAKIKVKADVVKEIWNGLELDGFPFRSLLLLENLQILEKSVSNGLIEPLAC